MRIDASYPGGRIAVLAGDDPADLRLSIPPDTKDARFRQWFSFTLHEAEGAPCTLTLVNASECTWKRGFAGYRVCASDDGETWFRVPTEYDGAALRFRHTPGSDAVRFAYFAPYDAARVEALVRRAVSLGVEVGTVATSVEGTPMPMLTFGARGQPARKIWVIAQQHPGEPQGGWFAEGLVARLGAGGEAVDALLAKATIHVVPRMNPDGCALGNHRTNAAGADLNRRWLEPGDVAPEVAGVRAAMLERGCDLFLDAHADEVIPHVFVNGTDRTARITGLERSFAAALMTSAAPDFQTRHGYPRERGAKPNLAIASSWAASRFDCLSLTLEMPFIDHLEAPDPARGWSPERSARLGARTVDAIAACLAALR